MELPSRTVSTLVLGPARVPGARGARVATDPRGAPSSQRPPRPGSIPNGAAGRIDELARALATAWRQAEESRFEAGSFTPDTSISEASSNGESQFEAAAISPEASISICDEGLSRSAGPDFSAADGASADGVASESVQDVVDRLVRELAEAVSPAGRSGTDELRVRHPELPEPALRRIADAVSSSRTPVVSESVQDPAEVSSPEESAGNEESRSQYLLPKTARTPWYFPSVGETVGDFRLLSCLGRGSHGAVFLADQPSLANRPVVLKVTACDGLEHLSLAQLRHPHIVPLYCVQDILDRNLRLLCMPYLGGAPLARLWHDMAEVPVDRRSGRDWLSGLDQAQSQADPPLGVTSHGPARAFLARADYLASVCWIGACLADALQFAHQCGLVHLDIKPSNVLMAADGMPMLLDFHLARPPIDAGERVRRGLGGTPLYMSPEQRAAMREIHDGRPVTQAVDGRSDIYSLGLVLYQLLGGVIAMGAWPLDPVHLRRPAGVPVGLGDIIARCLAVDPRERYPDAAQLAEDLRRHLADLPLRGVRNRSLSERWRKWNRRHPQALVRAASTAMVAPVMIVAACVVAGADAHRRLQGAQSLLDDSRRQIDRRDYPAAARDLRQGLALIDHPWVGVFGSHLSHHQKLRRDLTTYLSQARHLAMAEEIHELAERLRFLYGAELESTEPLRALDHHLRATWEARDRIVGQLSPELDPEHAGRLKSDLLDLGILRASLRVRLAGGSDADARREALRTLDEAERSFGPSPVLACERQAHAQALGLVDVARAAAETRGHMKPRTAWEHYAIGRSLMAAGSLEAAAIEFDRATDLEPQDLWAQFSRGICAYRLHHHETALRAFDVCVALAPDTAQCYYNRARAHAALGHAELARRDDDHARRLAAGTARAPGPRRPPQGQPSP